MLLVARRLWPNAPYGLYAKAQPSLEALMLMLQEMRNEIASLKEQPPRVAPTAPTVPPAAVVVAAADVAQPAVLAEWIEGQPYAHVEITPVGYCLFTY